MSDDFLSDEDRALFRRSIGVIKPLQPTKRVEVETVKTGMRTVHKEIKPQREEQIYLSDYYTEVVEANTILSYCSHSIPLKRLRELRRGEITWESRLDLHGLRPEEAKERLIKYILTETELGHRCLLIIHGKGSRTGESPVLKNLVNHWLKQLPQILAFYSALARDGGNGALYVLLRRQRQKDY